jgi:hypothetical protein
METGVDNAAHPDDTLDRLALGLESLRPVSSPPAWAEITGPLDDPASVRWRDGFDDIFGFVAPPGCDAVAVVANGWGRGLESGQPGSIGVLEPGERRRIRVVCVVTRSGEVAGHLRSGSQLLLDQPPGAGRMLDCLLRCFQLPTAAPAVSTDWLLAAMWLSNVTRSAAARPGCLTWQQVAALHPALQVLDMAGEATPLDQLLVVLRAAAKGWNWTYLRHQAATDSTLAAALPPGTAQWMDEGMFSRWLADTWRAPGELLPELVGLLAPAVAGRLRRTLEELGVAGDARLASAL